VFIKRVVSALCLGAVLLAAILVKNHYGQGIFLALGLMMSYGIVREFLDILDKISLPSFPHAAAMLAVAVFTGCVLLPGYFNDRFLLWIIVVVVLALWLAMLCCFREREMLSRAINSLGAILLIFLPLNFITWIYLLGEGTDYRGRMFLLYLLLVTKSGDIGAYLVGSTSAKIMSGGNHKIVPSISPKKSWEGTIGGLICSIIVSHLMIQLTSLSLVNSWTAATALGIILYIGGFAGDLMISVVKRTAQIKDSGSSIPGMGGLLDVVDSLILNAPLFYLLIIYLG